MWKMAHTIKAFPTLQGEAAQKFLAEAERVDTRLTQKEKDETLARLRSAFRFIRGEKNAPPASE